VAIALAATLSAGCSPTKRSTESGQPQRSAWQQVLDQIDDDGTVGRDTALRAFSIAIGPVPGTPEPAGGVEVDSGTLAVHWALMFWEELSEAQQRSVQAALVGEPAPSGTTTRSGAMGRSGAASRYQAPPSPNVDCLTADAGDAAPFRALLAGIEAELGRRLGAPLYGDADESGRSGDFAVRLAVNTRQRYDEPDKRKTKMYAFPCQRTHVAEEGVVSGCTIHVNPEALKPNFSDRERRAFLIHEVVHCVLFARYGVDYSAMPAWYVEGVPTWVMTVLGGGDAASAQAFREYLDVAKRPLYRRSYDAVGFFAHLAETGTDVWPRVYQIGDALDGGGNRAGWDAAGVSDAFLDSWGPGYLRGRYPGQAWNTGGPGLPADHRPNLDRLRLGGNASVSVEAPVAGVGVATVDVAAEVMTVEPTGATRGRLATGGGRDLALAQAAATVFCAKPGGCACPSGSAAEGVAFTDLAGGPYYAGVTGGPAAGSVRLTGHSLEAFCKQRRETCVVGSWVTTQVHADMPGILSERGGAGVRLRLDASGQMTVEFTGMAPVSFSSGSGAEGTVVYSGTATQKVALPQPGTSSGTFQTLSGDWRAVAVTVQATKPFPLTLGPMPVGDLTGGGGGAVDGAPFKGSTWTCAGDTMTLANPPGQAVQATWTLRRTGPA
jgi:hypothetical protein